MIKLCIFTVGAVIAIDCSNSFPWTAQNYAAHASVHYNNTRYSNKWAALRTDVPGQGAMWVNEGTCDSGTAGEGPVTKIDCTGFPPYQAGSSYPGGKDVHLDQKAYRNKWFANGGDVPGKADVWLYTGLCEDGTASNEIIGPTVDCTGIHEWTPWHTYDSNKNPAHEKGKLYQTARWNEQSEPATHGEDWTYVGECAPGTNSTGTYENTNLISDNAAALLCNCCSYCATITEDAPACKDTITEKDKCYFTWCPDFATKNQTKCDEITQQKQLSWYLGDLAEGKKVWPKRFYAPYIDGGLNGYPPVSQIAADIGVNHFVMAFAYQDTSTEECVASLAGATDLHKGPFVYNGTKLGNSFFYEEVNKLREMGGDIILSFGGAAGTELADSPHCSGDDAPEKLRQAYSNAIKAVKVTAIDFDIEGNAASSVNRAKGWKNRFAAVKLLEQEYPDLLIIWTLPILPAGLTSDGLAFISDLMSADVRMTKFNAMTMDFGDATVCPNQDMHACEVSAMKSLAQQMFDTATSLNVTARYGWSSPKDVYPVIGSTPMIGLNDNTAEIYSLDNAKASMKVWQSEVPIGFLANWSVGRDQPCDKTNVELTCSSRNIQTKPYEFAETFASFTSE